MIFPRQQEMIISAGVAGISSPPRDLPPPGGGAEIPSDLALPEARSLRILPPIRDLALPPILGISPSSVFEVLIIVVEKNGEKIGHFDTCSNYSRCRL